MADHIQSQNQSGGITAKNVTIGDAHNVFPVSGNFSQPTLEVRPIWKYLGAVIGGIASIFGILQFFGISAESEKPKIQREAPTLSGGAMKESSAPKIETKISSNNQSGGITAHTVNVGSINMGSQPRVLNDQLAQQLLNTVPLGKSVTVVAVMGDQEAFQFASQVKIFLASRGYNVSGVNQAVYSQPVIGQHVNPKGDGFEIIIGGRG